VGELKRRGVDDSKKLSQVRRQGLAGVIKRLALRYEMVELEPAVIDAIVFRGRKLRKLNWLEAKAMTQVIAKLNPERAYVDASDVNAERFGSWISAQLPGTIKVISEHGADARYEVVGAASILAKVRRDAVLATLRNQYGDIGSGYSHDLRTRNFLRRWLRKGKRLPSFVRKSWKTVDHIRAECAQQSRQ
jgi:ribonuclease HII